MLDRGFVKLHRSILSWEWYDSPNTMRLFLHLLLTANYEPKKWRGTVIDRGQRVCSLATLAKETRLSVRTVRTCLERLISTSELTRQANPQYTVITINNYDKYQTPTSELTNDRQTTDKPTTNDRQLLKKDKESKKVKEIYPTDIELAELLSGKPQTVVEIITEWIAYKQERKDSYTQAGLKALIKKIERGATEHGEAAVASLVEESISNQYKGIVWDKLGGKNATPIRRTDTPTASRETTRPRLDFSKPRIPVPEVQGCGLDRD